LKYSGQEIAFFAFKFLGDESEINLQQTIQEFNDWKWVGIGELLDNIVYFKRDSYEKGIEELRRQGILD
jgi:putative (di)nucleoside polyphosphate hydrolase